MRPPHHDAKGEAKRERSKIRTIYLILLPFFSRPGAADENRPILVKYSKIP